MSLLMVDMGGMIVYNYTLTHVHILYYNAIYVYKWYMCKVYYITGIHCLTIG